MDFYDLSFNISQDFLVSTTTLFYTSSSKTINEEGISPQISDNNILKEGTRQASFGPHI